MLLDEEWQPGSFTKNFGWGPSTDGLARLHEMIRLGFGNEISAVPRLVFRDRVKMTGRPDFVAMNFFLFNKIIDGVDYLVVDELVFQALTSDHSDRFDKLAMFAVNFSYAGTWKGAKKGQRRPALWAYHYILDRVYKELNWQVETVSADDIQDFIAPHYSGPALRKLATNLNYFYQISHLDQIPSPVIERWWVDALFLALDRLIEDRRINQIETSERQYAGLLEKSGFFQLTGRASVDRKLAAKHLIRLYSECGASERFSDEHVKDMTAVRAPDLDWYLSNDPHPVGAIHPSNPRILKSIPRVCAMLAIYAGFEIISVENIDDFDAEEFVSSHVRSALDNLRERNVTPTLSADQLMKLTRDQ